MDTATFRRGFAITASFCGNGVQTYLPIVKGWFVGIGASDTIGRVAIRFKSSEQSTDGAIGVATLMGNFLVTTDANGVLSISAPAGWEVESESDYEIVMVRTGSKNIPVNHDLVNPHQGGVSYWFNQYTPACVPSTTGKWEDQHYWFPCGGDGTAWDRGPSPCCAETPSSMSKAEWVFLEDADINLTDPEPTEMEWPMIFPGLLVDDGSFQDDESWFSKVSRKGGSLTGTVNVNSVWAGPTQITNKKDLGFAPSDCGFSDTPISFTPQAVGLEAVVTMYRTALPPESLPKATVGLDELPGPPNWPSGGNDGGGGNGGGSGGGFPTAGTPSGWRARTPINGVDTIVDLPMPGTTGQPWEFDIPFIPDSPITIFFDYIDPVTGETVTTIPVVIQPEDIIPGPDGGPSIAPVITVPGYTPDFGDQTPPTIPDPDDPNQFPNFPNISGYINNPNDTRCFQLRCDVPYVFTPLGGKQIILTDEVGVILSDEEGNELII
jgi:hypothetical protein